MSIKSGVKKLFAFYIFLEDSEFSGYSGSVVILRFGTSYSISLQVRKCYFINSIGS